LHELLRLEPVVGNLKRRTTAAVALPDGTIIGAGELVDIAVGMANVDGEAVGGGDPLAVCPARPVEAGLSFGDGAHKCPGAHIAIQEADIFLHRLFGLRGLRMVSPPRVSINQEISGYELRGLVVEVG
jgi:cytochrome P450